MSKKLYPEEDIRNIANAIREKSGTQDSYYISGMSNAILNIPSGGGAVQLIPELPSNIHVTNFTNFQNYIDIIDLSKHKEITKISALYFNSVLTQTALPASIIKIIFPDSLEEIHGAASNIFLNNAEHIKEIVFTGDPPDLISDNGDSLISVFFYFFTCVSILNDICNWRILVPNSKINKYLTDTKWSTFSSVIRSVDYMPIISRNEWNFGDADPWNSDNGELAFSSGAIINNDELIIPDNSANNYVYFNTDDDSFFYNLNKNDIGRHYEYDIELGDIGTSVSTGRLFTFSSSIGSSSDVSIGLYYYDGEWCIWNGGARSAEAYTFGMSNYNDISNSNIKIILEIVNKTLTVDSHTIIIHFQLIINGTTKLYRDIEFIKWLNDDFVDFFIQLGSHRNSVKGTHIKSFKITKAKY